MRDTMVQGSAATGLQAGQFRCVASRGFGEGENAYPHAMAWYKDHLYVATTRCVLHLVYHRTDYMKQWPVYPVRPTKDPYKDYDIRGQVWRYHPPTDTWERVLVSPIACEVDGHPIPVFLGCRNMVVHRRAGESDDAL